MKKRSLFFIAALLCTVATLVAQKAPVKFGKVSMEELQMTAYAPDTSASAVVLYHYGYFNGNEFKFYLTRRVKVLKKLGTDMLDFVFDADGDAMVRAKVFNLADGKIVEEKVNDDNIYKERIYGDNFQYRIAFPNIKVGSVIDIETSHFSLPTEFHFQDVLMPTKHAELVLEENTYIEYRKRPCGYLQIPSAANNRYVMQDLPALKKEPFLSAKRNFIPRFEFDILRVSYPGFYKSYSTTWEAVNKLLRDDENFGGIMTNSSGFLSEIADSINVACKTPLEKTRAAYEAAKKVKWDSRSRLWTSSTTIGIVYKKGVGNSADINMILYLLLKRLDIKAYPLVLSTRSNGMLSVTAPTLYKLNYTVMSAIIDDKTYVMDASEKFAPFGLLPFRCLNHFARLVNEQNGEWVMLEPEKTDKEVHAFKMELTNDLKLVGEYTAHKQDYAALKFRKDFAESVSKEKYVQAMEENWPGLLVKQYQFNNIDSIYNPSTEIYNIELSNRAEQVNDMVMVNPFMIMQMTQNPFKDDERLFPVDFATASDKMVTVNIKIPEGYAVTEVPKAIRFSLPNNGGQASVMYQADGQGIVAMYRLQLKKSVYTPEEYGSLKELYNQLITKQAEPVIIKQVTHAANL